MEKASGSGSEKKKSETDRRSANILETKHSI